MPWKCPKCGEALKAKVPLSCPDHRVLMKPWLFLLTKAKLGTYDIEERVG